MNIYTIFAKKVLSVVEGTCPKALSAVEMLG
jgi:hypothetical protein